MLATMKHRAPDDEGIVEGNGFYIGMGRLKIVDLDSPGLCPIQKGNLTLTFNGEIYNYESVRALLERRGHRFATRGDSEVLLEAYREWGPGCLDKLNGMFAFAIYDGKQIFLARDIAGEKPLYYSLDNGLAFASEAKALRYECDELLPAHCATYDFRTGRLTVERWWRFRPIVIDPITAVDELDELLGDAVRIRTTSEVPYGLYYSGGIDSTLISTYHNFKEKLTYEDEAHTAETFQEVFSKIVWHLDGPIKSFSAYGLYTLAREARARGLKIVLSGEGADELFGGYVRYLPNEFNRVAREKFPSYTALFPYRDMMQEEFHGNMQELLRMGDRMASAWGIENRCPFLDKRVIEFAWSLPPEMKIRGMETKWILRELLKKRMPDYQFEEKQGLYCSIPAWLGVSDLYDKTAYLQAQHTVWRQ